MSTAKKNLPLWKIRWANYEFWPFYLFYAPVYPYGLQLALKARSFTYFTAANPGLHLGGLLNTSKADTLAQLHAAYVPKSVCLTLPMAWDEVEQRLVQAGLSYPLVAKPDKAERGKQVEKINTAEELKAYLGNVSYTEVLCQEWIEYNLELGILYYRMPDTGVSGVTSVVKKEFLTLEGDGVSTVETLIRQHIRARFREDYLRQKYAERLQEVLPKGKRFPLEPIGNHNRGTTFLNGNSLINADLVRTMDRIAAPLQGFYYGRFDLKVKSVEDLYAGQHIKVMEINGVNSEPAHIYQPGYSLWQAYRDIRLHMEIIYDISRINHRKGIAYAPVGQVLREIAHNLWGW